MLELCYAMWAKDAEVKEQLSEKHSELSPKRWGGVNKVEKGGFLDGSEMQEEFLYWKTNEARSQVLLFH